MATNVATITGKVLIQIADGEPVEVGTVEIPIYAGTGRPKATRGREVGTALVQLTQCVHTPQGDS